MFLKRKSSKDEEFNLFDDKGSSSGSSVVFRRAVVISFVVLAMLGVGVLARTTLGGRVPENESSYVIYAKTLNELKKEAKDIEKKYNDAVANRAEKAKEVQKHKGDWFGFTGGNKAVDEYEKADKEVKKYSKLRDEIYKRISDDPRQHAISDIERSRSLNERDGGKDFANKEFQRTQQRDYEAAQHSAQYYDIDGSRGNGTAKAKSKADENSKKAKTKSQYSGGTAGGVTKNDVKRNYVKDSRRSETDAIRFISDDPATAALMESTMNTVNSSIRGKYLLVYSKDGMLSFSNKVYQTLEEKDKRKVMELSLKTVKESQLPSKVKVKVTNFITDQDPDLATSIQALNSDTSAKLSRGYAWFKPFSGPLSTLLGFLAIVIFVFLSSSIVFDTAYLTIGMFRAFLENGEGKPKFVTGEAWDTAKEVDNSLQSGSYRDYIAVYFRKRVGIFIVTALVLIYLISGQIYDIFTFLLQVFEEIFQIRG